jgi:hypothetical protein
LVTEKLAWRLQTSDPCRDNTGNKQEKTMSCYDRQNPYQKPSALGRFGSWLGRRPFESWGFFLAGFIVARILF